MPRQTDIPCNADETHSEQASAFPDAALIEQCVLEDLRTHGPISQAILALVVHDYRADGLLRRAILKDT